MKDNQKTCYMAKETLSRKSAIDHATIYEDCQIRFCAEFGWRLVVGPEDNSLSLPIDPVDLPDICQAMHKRQAEDISNGRPESSELAWQARHQTTNAL